MRKLIFFKALSLLLILSPLFYLCDAQSDPGDSASYRSALDNTIKFFYANSQSECTCLNGKEYIRSPLSFSEGSPYFLAAEASAGTILYDHVFYDDVHLLYDELQNDLVYVDESHQIMLLNEKVARFSILGNQFIQLRQDSGNHLNGYFQLLYEGNCLALKKEEKKIRVLNSFSGNEMTRIIDTRSDYYLKKGDDYFKIEGKKTFFELWGNYQKEIKGFIKSNKLKFNKELDIDYARLTAFCDRLSPVK